MRVLYICSSIPSRGIHHYAALLPIITKKQGIEVTIVSSPGESDSGVQNMIKQEGLEVVDFPAPEIRGFRSALQSASRLSRMFSEYHVDIVHVYGFASAWRCLLAQWLFDRKRKIPIVVTLESIKHGERKEMLARFVASQIFNHTPCTVCVLSSSEAKKMRRAGLSQNKMFQVANWIDTGRFRKKSQSASGHDLGFLDRLEKRFVLTYLAGLFPRKGHRYLIDAVRIVVDKYPEVLLVLAGDGPLRNQLEIQVEKERLKDNVLFTGVLSPQQVSSLLFYSHVGVVSSLSETFGYAIVEPLLADKPVVTTDVGIGPDLADAGGAICVPMRDPQTMADAILAFRENPKLQRNIALKGKAFVIENCHVHRVAKRYIEIYKSCLEH
jgi:glycosyltransferase involved in cell wall biosynthesis